jgi:hypothetical protein
VKTAKAVNLGVIFLTELGVIVAVAYWGFGTLHAPASAVGVLGPAALVGLWSLFGSPKARFKVRGAVRFAFELLWFGAGAAALYAAGQHALALAFALVCAVSKALAFAWEREPERAR